METLDYMIWADSIVFDLLEKMEDFELEEQFNYKNGSIRSKLLHLAQEYIAWLYDVTNKSWKKEIENLEMMKSKELISKIHQYHGFWDQFLQSSPKSSFEIDEGNALKVVITLNQLIFNLANHASYHRGQIIYILRKLGYKTPISDFYWYLRREESQ